MPRNQSFMLTQPQYRQRTKTVTRRIGWAFAKPGDIYNGVEQAQGLKKGQKIVVMGQHRIVSTRWEQLRKITDNPNYGQQEVIKEGFPDMSPAQFVDFFCQSHKGCTPETEVNRMEYEYLWTCLQVTEQSYLTARDEVPPYWMSGTFFICGEPAFFYLPELYFKAEDTYYFIRFNSFTQCREWIQERHPNVLFTEFISV